MNPFLTTDGYKTSHKFMYPEGTNLVQTNFTPRSGKHSPVQIGGVIPFGSQMVWLFIHRFFERHFFGKTKGEAVGEVKEAYDAYLSMDYDVTHIEELYDLGYLPIEVRALPENGFAAYGVPVLTVHNTVDKFYWLPTFLETLISNLMWLPITSATTASAYRDLLEEYAKKTDPDNMWAVDFQAHDFSMRGMASLDATVASSLAHALYFKGSDSLPVIQASKDYYEEKETPVFSVPATEHAVMCAGTKDDEIGTFRRLMETFPTGILSVVSDTWDLWEVCTNYLPKLKEEILSRDGKLVIRPDSGDPVDIICGVKVDKIQNVSSGMAMHLNSSIGTHFRYENKIYRIDKKKDGVSLGIDLSIQEGMVTDVTHEPYTKGVIELLWDVFGGTVNKQGYKVLDPHIGAIYGDSITLERAHQICKRLEAKGFASTNIVLGVGSYTYQYNTRDTHGLACKSTYVEVQGEPREIFKDPVTDDGTKKSAKGAVMVVNGQLVDQVPFERTLTDENELKVIYSEGKFTNLKSLTQLRNERNL